MFGKKSNLNEALCIKSHFVIFILFYAKTKKYVVHDKIEPK